MFIENKYTKWYFLIINFAKSQIRVKKKGIYYESHHIIPKSLGGVEEVLLTAKEHYICHLLLCKMVAGKNKHKMINGLIKMAFSKSKEQKRYTSRNYSLVRKLIAQKNSEMFKGVPKSETVKQNMRGRSGTWIRTKKHNIKNSQIQKKRFETIPGTFYGKKHKPETIEKYKNDERRKHYKNTVAKGRKHYNNGVENKMCFPGQEPEGFVLGRIMKNMKGQKNA